MKALSLCRSALACLGLGLGLWGAAAHAEDIDIFANPSSSDSTLPNVLLILDSSANWSSSISVPDCFYKDNGVATLEGPKSSNPNKEQGKKMAIEKCALYNVIDAMPVNTAVSDPTNDAKINIAIMLLNESPYNGSYPRKAFIKLSSANKATLKALIKGLGITDDKGSNADFARALYEAFLYYQNAAPYNGTGMTAGSSAAKVDMTAFASAGNYISPAAASCANNHVILIANGGPQSAESDIYDRLVALHANTTKIVYTNASKPVSTSDQNNWADEMARYMNSADVSSMSGTQAITVHTVAVTGASSDGTYPNYIEGIAKAGGGQYRSASTADTLYTALTDILNEIQAANTVFASASLPVSVNARGTYLNQVYMGMFRPDSGAKPRWRGNVKQYQFKLSVSGDIELVDSQGAAAISSSTGFITPSAVSYWTSSSSFWTNQLLGTPPSASDSPDGEVVEKGSTAQQLRTVYATSQADRKVYTCVGCSTTTNLNAALATSFADGNTLVTSTALGTSTAAERTDLINWLRGADNAGDENGPGGTTTIRPSVHGDVLHSRPAVVNYGGTVGVVVFYGGNDGMLHAMNGNQSGSGAGQELWSFVPEENFGKLKRLRANYPELVLPTVPGAASARDYFVDGPIGVYQKLAANGSSEKVYVYVGMRRGGRVLYAFDVTDPAVPKFMWRKTSTDLPELGQTWSEPKVARIKGNTNPVLIFGGGYDTAEDTSPAGVTTMGHRVYVLDAVTGELRKAFSGMTHAVAADVALVDSDYDGYVDRAYAVDLGGGIWRVNFENAAGESAVDKWSVYQVADLSGGTTSGRKFLFAPDVVLTKSFAALMLGSGDREKPLLKTTQDHFFTVYDKRLVKGAPETPSIVSFADLTASGTSSTTAGHGCYVALSAGEKVVNAATTIGGNTYFGTNQPSTSSSANTCSANLGLARSYAMPLFCQAPSSQELAGGGLPPSPVAGIVTIVDSTGKSKQVPFVIGAPNPKKSAIEGVRVNPVINLPRRRVYWYQETNR